MTERDATARFRRRITVLRDRMNESFSQILEDNSGNSSEGLLERFDEFRSQHNRTGPYNVRRRPRRRATCTFRVVLLNAGVQHYTCLRDGTQIQRIVVERDQTEGEFSAVLKNTFPQLRENFELCKVDAQRNVTPLSVTENSPSAILSSGQLGRSSLYIREKSTEGSAVTLPVPLASSSFPVTTPGDSSPQRIVVAHPVIQPLPVARASGSQSPRSTTVSVGPVSRSSLNLTATQPNDIISAPSSPDVLIVEETDNSVTVDDILREMVGKVDLSMSPTANQINVVREDIFDCAIRAFRRQRFNPAAKIDVIFLDADGTGEGAADEGGPTREFLRLLMSNLHSCHIFEGPDWNKTLACNAQALHDGLYQHVGRMFAVCLVQGGVEPHFFSNRLYNQITGLECPGPTVDEIGDVEFREKLKKIQEAETLETARDTIMETADQLAMLGAVRFINSMEERDLLVESAMKFYLESRIRDPLEQFKEGLKSLDLLENIKNHPGLFQEVFTYVAKPLLAADIISLFTAKVSDPGTNRRMLENKVIGFWRDWLLEVEEGGSYPLTLDKILIFASGASSIPRLGFPVKPQLTFLHPRSGQASRIYPEANTCSIELRLPLHHTYSKFVEYMDSGILQSPTFGVI